MGMKRRSRKRLLELEEKVSFVHLNVKSGYITYIEVPPKGSKPKVKGVMLEKSAIAGD